MNCVETDLLLQRHFDGELSPSAAFAVTRHLQRCLSCRLEFDKVRREMRDLIVDVAEPRFDAETMRAHIAASIARLRPRHPIPLAPVSISLSFLFAAFVGWNLFRAPEELMHETPSPRTNESRLVLLGAQIALEGDAELCEGSPARLHTGAATIEVPQDAGPFLLETPAGTISCSGGKYRVGVSAKDASSSLLVIEGEVGVEGISGPQTVHAGEAIFLKRQP